MSMREYYEEAQMEIISFETEDVITTSSIGDTPFVPAGLGEELY